MMAGLGTSTLTAQSIPTKNIFVYRNGDTNFQCKRIVVNPRQVKNWDSFIELVTSRIKAKNGGAVRRVFTPTGRTKVTDLSTIENNHFYVAAGVEGFRRHEYNKISGLSPQRPRLKLPPIIKPVLHSRLKVSARCKRAANAVGSRVIYVFRNGDSNSHAVKILFTKFMLKNYDVVLNEVTKKVNILTGAVWKLHSLDGKQIQGPEEFEDHEFYVACGRENFKKVPYPKDGLIISPRAARPAQVRRRIVPRLSKDSKASKPSPSHQKTEDKQKEAKPPRQVKKPTPPKPPKKEKSPEQKEAEEVFHSKPTIVKRSRERDQKDSLDFGDDPEGVFKAKEERRETKGASEVQETRDTAIELPIDQVVAEEVAEEVEEDIKGQGDVEQERQTGRGDSPAADPPELEPVNMVERMLENNEVPEDVPEDAPPAAAVDDDDDRGRDGGRSGDEGAGGGVVNGDDGEKEDGGAEEPQKEKEEEEEQPNAFLTDQLGEITNNEEPDEPAGFYSKRSPVTSKQSPILAATATASPSPSNGRVQTPNENNNNSALNEDVPSQNGDGRKSTSALTPHPPAKERSVPPSPARSVRRTQTPQENNNPSALSRNVPSQNGGDQAVESTESPVPIPSEHPASPAQSNGRVESAKENRTSSAKSRAVPSQNGGDQVAGDADTPIPAPYVFTARASPSASDRKVESPKEDKPASPKSTQPSRNGEDQVPGPAESPIPLPSEHNAPASPSGSDRKVESPKEDKPPSAKSRDVPSQNERDQVAGQAESPVPVPSEHNAPASPAGSNGKAQSQRENNSPSAMSKDAPSQNGDVKEHVESPPPQATEGVNAPASPAASNGRAETPKENNSPSALSRDVPSQNRESEVKTSTENPPPETTEQNQAVSPVGDNGGAQSRIENNSPQPENGNTPRENEGEQAPNSPTGQPDKEPSAPPSPAGQDGRSLTPKENSAPVSASRNSTQQSGDGQGAESPSQLAVEPALSDSANAVATDENLPLPQKDTDNGVVVPSREGEIAA